MKFINSLVIIFCLGFFLAISVVCAAAPTDENKTEITMRLIGHEILLMAEDSVSRVLPIQHEENRYKISFENEFGFEPSKLVWVIDSIILNTELAKDYRIEIQKCGEEEIVHSYEILGTAGSMLPCSGRAQPKDCYAIYFTNLDPQEEDTAAVMKDEEPKKAIYWGIPLVLAVIGSVLYFKSNKKPEVDSGLIALGKYQFDERTMCLKHPGENIELTGKEVDLLLLLHGSANQTIERDVILNKVWGDEGDYIGRTLDVFISKLRKKLELDPNVKIANVRGVGYKLILPVS